MTQPKNKMRASLSALTAAALALPGIAKAEVQTDYLFSHYQESDLPGNRSASGQGSERYKVDTHLFRLAGTPIAADQVAQLDVTYEAMSGASPWWVQPGANGKPVQVMSGASISENRVAVDVSYGIPLAGLDWGLRAGYSSENDYKSVHGGVEVQYTPEHKMYTVSGGIGYSSDKLDPTDGGSAQYPTRISHASKNTVTGYGGVSWVLSAQTTAQVSMSLSRDSGFLSDPYKQAYIIAIASPVADSRPDGRQTFAVTGKLRHYIPSLGAALRADARYYHGDWSIESHTVDLSWDQTIGDTWRVTPGVRWYSQSQAFFYQPYYADFRTDGFASSDYRLSPYGAIAGRVDVRKVLGKWELGGGVEYYDASANYAIKNVGIENPGLVQYWSANLRLSRRF
ncbi:DUF3570 domain-containing protein [Stenotrophobium rhamnosiphilum]|uniref:DUF3570 domain-containing protein n=1 Tax=Stenotrophobium rhamnosiphilum TaxID=2029166 RepID=A0A2T5MIN2_9GAMM|nr:DUF3570 domain-containing protein [Stenotrophobium rhamnosiphilum]PTU32443.1 hypothetical protein CJD38_07285 [Stenotrophobium rhamnosiphilum]